MENTKKIVIVSAGLSVPSNTSLLAERTAAKVAEMATAQNIQTTVKSVELREHAKAIMDAMVAQFISPELQEVIDAVQAADALIVATPVYKAGPSGLFTSFFQVLDNDMLIGTPVILTGSAGSARHALVVDEQLRGIFAYLRAITAPTALFAAPEDWGPGLEKRIERAATELTALVTTGFREAVRGQSWGTYQHSFSNSSAPEIDFNSDLMKLATGGN
ncbi:NADH-dependent FMN reductase [Leucobacter sp. OH2974_COT-288]|uniref:FMN reductase n=1 Tax=Canibacter oris TaxID=1365628 RepID=A0A840DPZ9_9MICO|nr:CE1759 family FMN reductase [Canibacter oris]MBB4071276.1 FMN reductase [Canibacter oris]RRD36640.1 NADH-dependent FMN reductase [Leucobacter sp. OH2974_COT-288]